MLFILLALQIEIFEEQAFFAYDALFDALFHGGQKGAGSLLICWQPVSIRINEDNALGGRNGLTCGLAWVTARKGMQASKMNESMVEQNTFIVILPARDIVPWVRSDDGDNMLPFQQMRSRINSLRKNSIFTGCSKRSRYKAPEIPRNEAYIEVRRNDEG